MLQNASQHTPINIQPAQFNVNHFPKRQKLRGVNPITDKTSIPHEPSFISSTIISHSAASLNLTTAKRSFAVIALKYFFSYHFSTKIVIFVRTVF